MRKLTVFNQQSVDGYFSSVDGDVSWTHTSEPDPEFEAFSAGSANPGGALLFGRRTYEMMASFWPSPMAAKQFPVLADHMNQMRKLVVSRTLTAASWRNTTILEGGDLVATVTALKREAGPDLALLGSGSLVGPLLHAGLIDQLGIMTIPVVLGAGRSMFRDLASTLDLALTSTRAFRNGRVYTTYEPRARG